MSLPLQRYVSSSVSNTNNSNLIKGRGGSSQHRKARRVSKFKLRVPISLEDITENIIEPRQDVEVVGEMGLTGNKNINNSARSHWNTLGCKLLYVAGSSSSLPKVEYNRPEIAFAGRSNVGKSSLLNALIIKSGNVKFARVSNTPGRTQTINFYSLRDEACLVDLPGYGYAAAPTNVIKEWNKLMNSYVSERHNLKVLCLLIDSRHGIQKVDKEFLNMVESHSIPHTIVLTKVDKVRSQQSLDKVLYDTFKHVEKHQFCMRKFFVTSTTIRFGIDELRTQLDAIVSGIY